MALEIRYRSAGAFLMSYSVNLSRGGLFIETQTPLAPGSELDLKLNTPEEETLHLRGQVAWVRTVAESEPGAPPGMGISVQTPEDRYGDLIDRIASHFHGIRVLLAVGKDHARNRAMLHRHLSAVVSCTIQDLESPPETLDASQFDLAVIDLDWKPGHDSFERLNQSDNKSPLVALSRLPKNRNRALARGAHAALESPPSFPDLRAAIISALATPEKITGK